MTSTTSPARDLAVEDLYPLSPLQEGLLFHAVSGGETQAYQVQVVQRLEGRLDAALFRRAWATVVQRHSILRTGFVWKALGRPLQRVESAVDVPWTLHDWRDLADEEQEAALDRFLVHDRQRGFVLERPPLLRCALFRIGDESHWFVRNQHHLVTDGWSTARITNEVFELYRAWQAGERGELRRVRRYRDFIEWLRQQDSAAAERYWRGVLAGFAAPTSLGVDRAAVAGRAPQHARKQLQLPAERTRQLETAARAMQVTLNTVVQGAWGLLLSRYSGEDDVVFGNTVAGRPADLEGVEDMVGPFINTLPVRLRVPADARLETWLGELQRTQAEARQYEYAGLAQVQAWSDVPPATPLFESLLIFENHPVERSGHNGRPSSLRLTGGRAVAWTNYPLSLMAAPGEGLLLRLSYDANRFDAGTIERMLGHLEQLLQQMAADNDVRLSELEIMGAEERLQVVETWNRTERPYAADRTLPSLIEAQVARMPDAVAVVSGAGTLTYAAVNARANRLAHHLIALGVGPEVRVALCLERAPEMVVALLAVLKAGGAYVPLDPSYPAQRLRSMLEDSQPLVLLVHGVSSGMFAGWPVPVIDLAGDAPAYASYPQTNPAPRGLAADHPCYVIYTSGSTGQPKGVMNQHRCVVNRLLWGREAWALGPRDAMLGMSSLSFDGSLRELFLPLSVGARVVLAGPGEHRDPDALLRTIQRERISTINLVPSMLRLLLTHPDVEQCADLERVLCGGEALPTTLLHCVRERLPHATVHNMYGPSEAATAMVSLHCTPDETRSTVHIGRPIANTRAYLLDGAGEPIPVGVAGELYVGGSGVARGYWDRPELTAERFVPDPFGTAEGARLYRTGDRGRRLPDGTIEFLGRNDHQVKVHGFRIETGEIEAVMRRNAGVTECVVLARGDAAGDTQLVAYWTGPRRLHARELRAYLAEHLPAYMVPAAYVWLERLPLMPNGKLDLKALPAAEGDVHARRVYEPPQDEIEISVAEIWSDVLGTGQVGRWDHFFELGGHSLRALQIISRVRQVLELDVPLRELFLRPVLADFARTVSQARRVELPPLQPVARDERLPLSFAQQRLWFIEQMGGIGAAFHVSKRLRLTGDLHRAALDRALNTIVARHEALRTTFVQVDDDTVQRIAPAEASGFALVEHDLGAHGDAQAEMRRLIVSESAAPFDLARGPLIRGSLFRLADDDHVLLVTMHHIVSDGWSMALFLRELGALYSAFCADEKDPLPAVGIQYADYAAWQRRSIQGGVLREQVRYWKEALAGAPETLDLPTDHPRHLQRNHVGARARVELDEELTARLKELSNRHGTTLFMTLLAGWATVLGRLAGQDDIVIGTPVANRDRSELEGLIGFFVNTLPLRLDLSGSPTLSQFLARVRRTALDAYEHKDVPFEQIVEAVQPARSLAHGPLFQVNFAWQNISRGKVELPGLTVGPVDASPDVAAKYDLLLELDEVRGRIAGAVTYASALFEPQTVERYVSYLTAVLSAMVTDPRATVDRVALMSDAERRQVVDTWGRTETAVPAEQTFHALFEAHAASTPDAAALVCEGATLSYATLNARANRLAHHLIELGVGAEVRVGLCIERSFDMVVALLGVLKAGGAYVPLDPDAPAERLAYTLTDSAMKVLVIQERWRQHVSAPEGVVVVSIDDHWEQIAARSADNPLGEVKAQNLAYVIYTSGSTGRPKGVAVEHAGLSRYLAWASRTFPGYSSALHSSYAFDLSVTSLLPLASGGCLDIIDETDAVERLARRLEHGARYGLLKLTPTHLQALGELLQGRTIRGSIECLVVGGESLLGEHLEFWKRQLPAATIVNHYGPTETVVGCCINVHAMDDVRPGRIPIGRPAPGMELYALDTAGAPAPIGVRGELYIGGLQVTRGYLARPGLTAERFVPNPFGGERGGRLYRTGDRVRWRADGALEYLERLDGQVKIRGFRIELGEIESALVTSQAVREARVLVREDTAGEKRLVAYVVGGVTANILRAHLQTKLPEYMMPAAFVRLDALPLTPNGKLDVRALPAPEEAGAGTYVAPRTPVEEVLAGIWAAVLRLERVGVTDKFFELGGHSLVAMRVVARAREIFGVELPVRAVFESPTVAALAARVETLRQRGQPVLPPIAPEARDAAPPLSFAQERLWVLDQLQPGSAAYNLPAACRLSGVLDVAALERALAEIVRRHETLRAHFAEADGGAAQVIAPVEEFSLRVEELGLDVADAEAAARRWVSKAAAEPFDLRTGPLFRARLLRIDAAEHALVLSMHHSVSDGWSLRVLYRELSALYGAFLAGDASPLPPLTVQYADYAVWQRSQLQGEVLANELAYWRQRLTGAPALLELPTDRPRPAMHTGRGAKESIQFPLALLERLRALGQGEGATLYMVLLAAFQILLSKYSGSEDIVVGTPIAGRTRREIEDLIGFFVNTLVLRTDLSSDPSFRDVLRRVRETTLEAYDHQEVPFEKLVAELHPERSLSHAPLLQVMFQLREARDAALDLPGLRLQRLATEIETAKFDIILDLTAHQGGLGAALTYSTDLFDRRTIARMLGHLEQVLEQVAADADRRLSALDIVGAEERIQIVEAWNRAETAYPVTQTIHALVEAQVAKTPDAVALTFGTATLTYAELNARANRLARHLIGLGVRPDVRVGLCMERSLEMVVSILAVLKAGGAYVPLDPSYPAERLAFMLADSGVAVLLTEERWRDLLPAPAGVAVVSVDGAAAGIAAHSVETPRTSVEPGNLAYVIYTSGSTGRPKGVLIEHRHVLRLFAATSRWFDFGERDVWTLFHSYAFDFSVWEIWGALLYGGRLVVVPHHVSRDPEAFHALAQAAGVTVLNQTPSAFRQFLRADAERGGELALRVVIFGGEALDLPSLRPWVQRHGAETPLLVNMYGITETTVHTTYRPLSREEILAGAGSPIGERLPDLQLYVRDRARHLAPVGVAGELYIGGGQVARGYLGRAALTAERFEPDPFGEEPGARLYRTGDRVRWRADGTLECLGRLDAQVKIRGFRIELGEIESALATAPGVREARVLVREDVPGEKRLVAYVVGDFNADALRTHLRLTLPEYMVPAAFVRLDAFPLTENGKLDALALPAPDAAVEAETYVAPHTSIERTLAEIWAAVLRLTRVGVTDNFFAVGGDSILAIQMVSRARQAGLALQPRQLFEHQTIAELASVATVANAGITATHEDRPEGVVALTPIQQWFFAQEQPEPWHHNQSWLLAVPASVSDLTLEVALQAVLAHHDGLRLRFRRTEAGCGQWYGSEVGIALQRVDLTGLTSGEQDRVQGETAARLQRSLNLEQGPVGRAALFDRGAGDRTLFLVLHHLVVDGVSWRILREDLAQACAQVAAGTAVALGARSASYGEWADVLARYAVRATDELEYWRAQSPSGIRPLPVDGERDQRGLAGSETVTVQLDEGETRALLQDVPAAYRTQINDVLLCALAEAVGAWTGSPRVRLALEGHGREEGIGAGIDLTRTVGWFTVLYPVVLDTSNAYEPGERLKRVKEQLSMVPRRGIGYGVLRYLSPDPEVRADLASQAEPEIVFNYLGQFTAGNHGGDGFRFGRGPRGGDRAPSSSRAHALSINSSVRDGSLRLHWTYATETYRRGTIESVAGSHLAALRSLIAHCREEGAGGYTPSDFPLAALSQRALDSLLAGRRGVEDLYPLSPLQEGLLFHAVTGEGTQAYQVQVVHRLDGPLDVDLFRRAWAAAVERHAILRTGFVWNALERPLQRVESVVEVPWRIEDWRGATEEEREAALSRYLAQDRQRGFVLESPPLMRFAMFRVGDESHWFVRSQHHLITDGWSTARLTREVFALYGAWRAGDAGDATDLRRERPYRDYIDWLQRQDAAAAERYWRGVLAGFTAPTSLGVGRAAGAGVAPRPAAREVRWSAERTQQLETAARAMQVTLNTLVQGAWAVLLSRYSGDADVVFGSTVAGRPAELDGVEEMIGPFINALPVRVRVPMDVPLRTWLGELQRTQVEARQYEYASLAQVQRWSEVPAGTPLFESLVTFENHPRERGAHEGLPGVQVSQMRAVEWTNYPLALVAAARHQLLLRLSYDEHRFDASTVERMLECMECLLAQVTADANVPVSELMLLDAAERVQVIDAPNETDRPYPHDLCAHELFDAQVRERPEAVAVEWGGEVLTYAALAARANRLAHLLVDLGVGPEVRVGLCFERGLDLVVSTLAVLKAGGAYVPLDPSYPIERLRFMLADAGVTVLLQARSLVPALEASGIITLDLAEAADTIAQAPITSPRSGANAANLAYIVYTSGSTGRPKGVMVGHREVAQLIVETDYVALQPGDRVAQASNASFDALTFEVWGALLTGATLVGIPQDVLLSPAHLRAWLRAQRITTLYQTTALLNQLSREQPDVFASVREVLFGGQAVDAASVRRILRAGPPARLLHMYGPTETTAWCSWHAVDAVADDARTVSVGRPTGNARIYLLDGAAQPVPRDVPGEACVGGAGIVRGYWARPALTAERFVPDPFGCEPGCRLYRTGDRLLRHADGALEFVGRLDAQVKIHGFRIEPGEVEAALTTVPGVREARVLVREDTPGDLRLVAYVVGDVAADVLRTHLQTTLPAYMVPAAFVGLEALPLTPNHKLDVQALPMPDVSADAYVAPRTPVEEVLAEIWSAVLRLDRVGVTDNFFEVGGHSLVAMRLVSRVREVFAIELPVRALFEAPTVATLAARVEALRQAGTPVLPPIVPTAREGAVPVSCRPLSFAQERVWLLDRMQPGTAVYNIRVVWRLSGALDMVALEWALGEIVRRHEALRARFAEVDGMPVQVIVPADTFATAVDELWPEAVDPEAAARQWASLVAAEPFDLNAGPLFRARLLRLAAEEHVLLLSMHHSVSDGWSVGVLCRELSALYAAFVAGASSPLPPLPVQYADYAVWQRTQLQGEPLDRELTYWKTRLAGAPALLDLPTDRPRPAVQTGGGAQVSLQLPAALVERLRLLGRHEGATLYMVLLAAFQVLLSKYSGSEDVVVGSPIAGRTRREVEDLIGFFVNTLVLRTDLSGDPRFRDVLARVREVTLGAYEHQQLPFEKLVAEIQPERSLSRSPLFQVMFQLREEGSAPDLPGLRLHSVKTEIETTKFDLTLHLASHRDGIAAVLAYSTDLFERRTAERMLAHLERVLKQVTDDADVRLSELALIDADERMRVVEAWNLTEATCPSDQTIQALVEAQVKRTPDAVALVFGNATLTYAALNARANRLAHYLMDLGVGPEARVGLCLERSLAMVVSILGVLKTGAAYVPLDPDSPAERLAYMLTDSGVEVVLTQERWQEVVTVHDDVKVVSVDGQWKAIDARSPQDPRTSVTPRNLAYVIYTSGSTGQPKGVAVDRAALSRYLDWAARTYPGHSAALHSSYAFDMSVTSVFVPLLSGGLVDVVEETSGIEMLGRRLEQGARYGILKLTPTHLQALGDWLQGRAIEGSVECLVVGGEALLGEHLEFWKRQFPKAVVINEYGPTEAAVGCSIDVRLLSDVTPGAVPIGRPAPGTQLYVLDAAGSPAPIGVPAELYIGGEQLARGYLGRPGLTAERFIPDPFAREAGGRLYKTGDRVRWLADGMLEYFGRLDAQVKIRGFRIELGEIEAALAKAAGVREARVLVRQDTPGEKRMVAYVVGDAGAEALRAHLRTTLPEYMVPAAFVHLDALPFTPGGKLEVRRLPAPEYRGGAAASPPRNAIEVWVAEVWRSVLGVADIGVRDNFFDLGGNSLLLYRVYRRFSERRSDLRVVDLFRYTTVADLAAYLGAGLSSDARRIEQSRSRGKGRRQARRVRASA